MARSLDLLTDACIDLPATSKRMFGGHGFFAPNGGMFAGIVTDDEIILKLVPGPLRDELIALGGHPWVYRGRGNEMTMEQWIVVPTGFYDDAELLQEWAARALAAAPAKQRSPKRGLAAPKAKRAKTSTKAPKSSRVKTPRR